MDIFRLRPLAALALVAVVLAGCTTTGNNGQVRGGAGTGWENFRAAVPDTGRVSAAEA